MGKECADDTCATGYFSKQPLGLQRYSSSKPDKSVQRYRFPFILLLIGARHLLKSPGLVDNRLEYAAAQVSKPAVFVDKNTKVIIQGMTGKNGSFHAEQV